LIRGLMDGRPADASWEIFFDERQLAIQRSLQGETESALKLWPCPYFRMLRGIDLYTEGRNTARAMEQLRIAYDGACESGFVHLMLLCRVYLGNCCSEQRDIEGMLGQSEAFRSDVRLDPFPTDERTLHRESGVRCTSDGGVCGMQKDTPRRFCGLPSPLDAGVLYHVQAIPGGV